jgi:hypothetical protein
MTFSDVKQFHLSEWLNMFMVLTALYKVTPILQTTKIYLAVTCTVEMIAKQETIQIYKSHTRIHYKGSGLPNRKEN